MIKLELDDLGKSPKKGVVGVFFALLCLKSHLSHEKGMKTYDVLKMELIYEVIQKESD